jgi:hypothetical protein
MNVVFSNIPYVYLGDFRNWIYLRTSPVLESWFAGSSLRGCCRRKSSLLGLVGQLFFLFSPFLGFFLVRPIMLSFWNNHQINIFWQKYYQRVFLPLISRVNTRTRCRVLFIWNVVIDFKPFKYYLNWKCWNIPFYQFWLTLSLNKKPLDWKYDKILEICGPWAKNHNFQVLHISEIDDWKFFYCHIGTLGT